METHDLATKMRLKIPKNARNCESWASSGRIKISQKTSAGGPEGTGHDEDLLSGNRHYYKPSKLHWTYSRNHPRGFGGFHIDGNAVYQDSYFPKGGRSLSRRDITAQPPWRAREDHHTPGPEQGTSFFQDSRRFISHSGLLRLQGCDKDLLKRQRLRRQCFWILLAKAFQQFWACPVHD